MIEATIHVDDVEIIPHLIPRVAALQTNLVKFNGLFTPRIIACFKHFFASSPIFPVMFLDLIYDFQLYARPCNIGRNEDVRALFSRYDEAG